MIYIRCLYLFVMHALLTTYKGTINILCQIDDVETCITMGTIMCFWKQRQPYHAQYSEREKNTIKRTDNIQQFIVTMHFW